jgi:hypothetical protein
MATTTYYMSGISLILQYLTALGVLQVAAGGKLYTNVGGMVATPVTTYTDSTGTVPNANPLTLSSVGTPSSASGAPVAFWVPGGTVVQLIVTDALGNQLFFLDNVPALNDLTGASTSLATQLASAASSNVSGQGPVAGVDLVANAVKSYDVFADVRAANTPQLVTGQTLNIEVQGGLAAGDGLGGFFYWSPTSTAADDGRTVLKPNTAGGPGRWLRYYPLGVPLLIVKGAAQQVASSTVLANDNTLFATLAGGATYLISLRAQLLGVGATGQGWKVAFTYSGSIAADGAGVGVTSGNLTPAATMDLIGGAGMSNAAISDSTPDAVNMDYVLVTNAGGTLQLQFAQDASNAAATQMNKGSMLSITRVA